MYYSKKYNISTNKYGVKAGIDSFHSAQSSSLMI